MRTVMDVKRALDQDLYVNMVHEMRAKRGSSVGENESMDQDLFVEMLPAMKKQSKFVKKSNVIIFPGAVKSAGKRMRRCK